MNQEENVYRDLQKHLDQQAVSFPASKSGAEIRILKRFFNPEEAQLAMQLSYKPSSVEKIFEKVKQKGITRHDIEEMLEVMAKKGVIGHSEKAGNHYYYTIPFVVGMYEWQLNKLSPAFLAEVAEYVSEAFGKSLLSTKLPQMRVVPIEQSILVEHHVTTYDNIREIIEKTDGPIVVNECICRKAAGMRGNSCHKTTRLETCMGLGEWAKNSIRAGVGRSISKAEALEIMRQNESEGLVLQPSNTQKVEFVCSCCGCCCGILRIQKMMPKPVNFWSANFYASVNTQNCTGCKTCVERCQVNAIKFDEELGVSGVNLDRCIGCGNCVATCPSGALSLIKKEKEIIPPTDSEELYETIMAGKKEKSA